MLIHQPSPRALARCSDIEIQAREILRMRACWRRCSPGTPASAGEGPPDIERDKILTAEEAKAYGLIDDIIPSRKKRAQLWRPDGWVAPERCRLGHVPVDYR